MEFPYDVITEHCKNEYPKEACGLVIVVKGKYRYIPCENTAGDRTTEEFCISSEDWANAEDMGEVVTVVHSHPSRDASPGETDKLSQAQHGVDWLIVGLNNLSTTDFFWLKGEQKKLPLYGRKYVWHISDCYSFIRDFYNQEFSIDLPDFYRQEKFWQTKQELYLDGYEQAGFYPIEMRDLQYGDVILFNIGSEITTHGGVYVGDNKLAHHFNNRLSCVDVLGRFYLDRATKHLRHKDIENVKNDKVVRGTR